MLKYLHIENIAVIERSDIEFSDGFNVLTGETGAGKSIIIDSINAVLGERTSKDLIRAGCDSAEVSALFGDFSVETVETLKQYDISPDSDGNILIVRRLSLSGKGMIKINGKPVTASILKEISGYLINIHGQHDNQALLNPEKHCDFIDAIAQNTSEQEAYYAEFKKLNSIRRELNSLEMDEDEKQHKIELLKYQIDELTKADIKPGEIDQLKKNLEIAEDFETTVKSLNNAIISLRGADEADGAITLLSNASKQISLVKGDIAEKNHNLLCDIISTTEDVTAEIEDFLESTEFSEINSDKINQRLDLLHKLMLKYGNSEEQMLQYLENAKSQLDTITFSEKKLTELSDELENSKQKLIDLGAKLTKTRTIAAQKFENAVINVLCFLNMPSVAFKVRLEQGRYTKRGCDEVEFLISANKGEALKPLHKIASGGELSRTMLAIKSCMVDSDPVDTMIFDEIDTGISGFAAGKVGIQLKKVSKNRQVICVTHLAQIAALADAHLLIEKNVENGRTFTGVLPLDYDQRIHEIARIMSGSQITDNLYNSAKELIDRSIENENL